MCASTVPNGKKAVKSETFTSDILKEDRLDVPESVQTSIEQSETDKNRAPEGDQAAPGATEGPPSTRDGEAEGGGAEPIPVTPDEEKAALQWALLVKWRSRGSIIPVGPHKRPIIGTWKEYQTRRPTDEELRQWLSLNPWGWALLTGALSGVVVVDWDRKKHAGEEFPIEDYSDNFLVQTQSGGCHVYYQHPGEKVPNAEDIESDTLGLVDVRGDGGYVLIPELSPKYTALNDWQDPEDLPLPPAWVSKKTSDGQAPEKPWKERPELIDWGKQNDHLISWAGRLARDSSEEMWPELGESVWAVARQYTNDPSSPKGPWTRKDSDATWESACRMERERRGKVKPWRMKVEDWPLDAEDLHARTDREIPLQRWLIPWLLPEGGILMTLAKPKKGKSTISSQATLHVTNLKRMWGTSLVQKLKDMVLGPEVSADERDRAEVLILSLEEKADNLASRIKKQFEGMALPAGRVHAITYRPVQLLTLLDWLDEWMQQHPETRLIILDPWVLVFHEDATRDPYLRDYQKVFPLKLFIGEYPKVSFWINNHSRKAAAMEITDASLSTSGLPGAVDATIWFQREGQEPVATIEFQDRLGKSAPKIEVRFDEGTLRWEFVGLAREVAEERNKDLVKAFLQQHNGEGRIKTSDFQTWLSQTHKRNLKDRAARDVLTASGLLRSFRGGNDPGWEKIAGPGRDDDEVGPDDD